MFMYFEGIGMQLKEDNIQKETELKFRQGWNLFFQTLLIFLLYFGGLFIVCTLSYILILTFHLFLYFYSFLMY